MERETLQAITALPRGTVAEASMALGVRHSEPLLIAMDAMLRYAKAYRKAYDMNLADDGVLGEEYEQTILGIRRLLNGNGAVAMERGITTDSKDNGVIESLYWECRRAGGYSGG